MSRFCSAIGNKFCFIVRRSCICQVPVVAPEVAAVFVAAEAVSVEAAVSEAVVLAQFAPWAPCAWVVGMLDDIVTSVAAVWVRCLRRLSSF